jgi:hypothetical protein
MWDGAILGFSTYMPAKPMWYARLDQILAEIRSLPYPWIDRLTLQKLLRVGPRRAQQILQPLVSLQLGANGLADRQALIEHLKRLASSEAVELEQRRRERFREAFARWREERLKHPQVLTEAPSRIVNQKFDDLPAGVRFEPGRITLEFETPEEALERLLALAMAIGNDFGRFDELTGRSGGCERRVTSSIPV